MKKIILLAVFLIGLGGYLYLAHIPAPQQITYGVSFSANYSEELGLDWRETYAAILDEMGARNIRLAAYWPSVEPVEDQFDFSEVDYQLDQLELRGGKAILAIGKRLPRWPECHVPEWIAGKSSEEQQKEQLEYMRAVVDRYKNHRAVEYWQVENEPYLVGYAKEFCGEFDEEFFQEELDLVRELDSSRKIITTDSGELGQWIHAYSKGDIFGTTLYIYLWDQNLGAFRTLFPPSWYRAKTNLVRLFAGDKPSILIELSIEPWLGNPIVDTPINIQFERMNAERFDKVIKFGKETRFDTQYLWGAEWWYWLKIQGYPELWEKAKNIFR